MNLSVNGRVIQTDEEGFLEDPHDWDETVARQIAADEDLPLDEARWAVVRYVRQYFEHNGSVPEARHVLRAMSELVGPDKATRKYLYSLFPYGYGQQACKIAGMRKPRKLMLDV